MRPEGWNSETIAQENMPMMRWGGYEYAQVIRGIDIGADAMLRALKDDGVFTYGHHTPDIYLEDARCENGYWVFIEGDCE